MIRRIIRHKFLFAVCALAGSSSLAFAQGPPGTPVSMIIQGKDLPIKGPIGPIAEIAAPPVGMDCASTCPVSFTEGGDQPNGFLVGTREFRNFIGFISNPVQSIDPRATTEIWPIFGSGWAEGKDRSFLPTGNTQVYGAGVNVALSDRLSVGLNQGGYAVADFSGARAAIFRKLGLPIPNQDLGGQREGWLNLGGYIQYTLIADVPNQFLLTAGLRWEAPSGATQLFQGSANPAYLAPYLTVGKEFGNNHILATTGYEFPAGTGDSTSRIYYLNVHLDHQFGWFYPLVEFNGAYRTNSASVSIATPRIGVIDLGTFESTGNSLTVAVGANAVLVPGKLELGAVYTRPIASQGNFDVNGMLVKMVYRY